MGKGYTTSVHLLISLDECLLLIDASAATEKEDLKSNILVVNDHTTGILLQSTRLCPEIADFEVRAIYHVT